jgi:hypothetical protein
MHKFSMESMESKFIFSINTLECHDLFLNFEIKMLVNKYQ